MQFWVDFFFREIVNSLFGPSENPSIMQASEVFEYILASCDKIAQLTRVHGRNPSFFLGFVWMLW
jgi:hypothetical protein